MIAVLRRIFSITLSLFVLLLAVYSVNLSPTLAGSTTLYVDPPSLVGLSVGDAFTINVTISDVVDLYGWQFQMTYLKDVLNATSISEGPFLKKDGASTFTYVAEFTDNYNATHGLIIAACSRMNVAAGVDGGGTLATIAFKVKATLSTVLHLFETKIVDSHRPFGNPIPHTAVDGEVSAGYHDVAVTNLVISTTSVYRGQPVQFNVTVKNNGDYAETFNVAVYYDASSVGTQVVNTLPAGSQSTLVFMWNTGGVDADRTYSIRAEAAAVAGETNLNNNVLTDGTVTVRSYPVFLIAIAELSPCNQSGYPVPSFEAGSIGYFKVTVNVSSFESKVVLVTLNAYDYSDTTLGVVSFKGDILPGTSTFILGLPIPSSASRGTAKVYANAFTDWLYLGGVPYCPEASAAFQIVSPGQ